MTAKQIQDVLDDFYDIVYGGPSTLEEVIKSLEVIYELGLSLKDSLLYIRQDINHSFTLTCGVVGCTTHLECREIDAQIKKIELLFQQDKPKITSDSKNSSLDDFYDDYWEAWGGYSGRSAFGGYGGYATGYKRATKPKVPTRPKLPTEIMDEINIHIDARIMDLIKSLEVNHAGLEFGFLIHYDYKITDVTKDQDGNDLETPERVLDITVSDFSIVPAKIEHAETQLLEKITIFQDDAFIDKCMKYPYLGYLHSHNSMGAFHSGTDVNTFFEEVTQKKNVFSIVTSYKNDWDYMIALNGVVYKLFGKQEPSTTTYYYEEPSQSYIDEIDREADLFARWLDYVEIKDWIETAFPKDIELDINKMNDFLFSMNDITYTVFNQVRKLNPKSFEADSIVQDIFKILAKSSYNRK